MYKVLDDKKQVVFTSRYLTQIEDHFQISHPTCYKAAMYGYGFNSKGKHYEIKKEGNKSLDQKEIKRIIDCITNSACNYCTNTDLDENYLMDELKNCGINARIVKYDDLKTYVVERVKDDKNWEIQT